MNLFIWEVRWINSFAVISSQKASLQILPCTVSQLLSASEVVTDTFALSAWQLNQVWGQTLEWIHATCFMSLVCCSSDVWSSVTSIVAMRNIQPLEKKGDVLELRTSHSRLKNCMSHICKKCLEWWSEDLEHVMWSSVMRTVTLESS